MSEKDLIIGDNVTFGSEIHKVLTIDSDGLVFLDGCDDLIPIGLIEPIPITPEILEKNGFKLQERTHIEDFENWVSEDARIEINHLSNMQDRDWSIHIDNELYESIGCVDIEYVHELQHALRLCKIDKEIEL